VLGRNLEGVVNRATELRTKMGDSFTSVEHLVLGLAEDSRFGAALLKGEALTVANLEQVGARLAAVHDGRPEMKLCCGEQAVTDIRGKSKVQDQDPEGKYEALSKYARDLTQVWLAAASRGPVHLG
jgi:ATP-dependent Clp protease ATP-binding subunit ClpB